MTRQPLHSETFEDEWEHNDELVAPLRWTYYLADFQESSHSYFDFYNVLDGHISRYESEDVELEGQELDVFDLEVMTYLSSKQKRVHVSQRVKKFLL